MPLRAGIAIGLLVLTAGFACSRGAEAIPACDGLLQVTMDHAAGFGFQTREAAAIHALEASFEIDVSQVVLVRAEGRLFHVVLVDTTALDPPPKVSIERTEDGFLGTGIVC